MNGSLFRSGRKLGSRIGGRVRKNREMSSGRVGPPMGGPMYASQCLVLGVYRNEGGSVPPSSHLWFMWEIMGPNQGSGDRGREGQIDLRNIFKVKSTGISNLIGF